MHIAILLIRASHLAHGERNHTSTRRLVDVDVPHLKGPFPRGILSGSSHLFLYYPASGERAKIMRRSGHSICEWAPLNGNPFPPLA